MSIFTPTVEISKNATKARGLPMAQLYHVWVKDSTSIYNRDRHTYFISSNLPHKVRTDSAQVQETSEQRWTTWLHTVHTWPYRKWNVICREAEEAEVYLIHITLSKINHIQKDTSHVLSPVKPKNHIETVKLLVIWRERRV